MRSPCLQWVPKKISWQLISLSAFISWPLGLWQSHSVTCRAEPHLYISQGQLFEFGLRGLRQTVSYRSVPVAKRWLCEQWPLPGNAHNMHNNGVMQPISKQWFGKHVPAETNNANNRRTVFSTWSAPKSYLRDINGPIQLSVEAPCGGGFEYLHRSPASRMRLWKGNPVPRDITGSPCSYVI
jgi:hypothetical protein